MKKIFFALVAILPLAAGYLSGIFSLPDLFPDKLTGNAPPTSHRYQSTPPARDVTSQIEYLGNPFEKIYPDGAAVYARNVWDLQLFADKIFIGAGNSSNKGPASNAGPVKIKIYDLRSGQFSEEGTVDEEQIDIYRVLNQRLYIPGHDPTESWKFGNFYRRNNDGIWKKYRNISEGLHTYDMAWFNDSLYAALGTDAGGAIMRSGDEGQTWNIIYAGNNRVYSFLETNNTLFGASKFATGNSIGRDSSMHGIATIAEKIFSFLHEYVSFIDVSIITAWSSKGRDSNKYGIAEVTENAVAVPRFDIDTSEIFPDTLLSPKKYAKIVRPLSVGDKAVYIGAYIHNDHQYMPFGLYVATSLRPKEIKTSRIPLPDNMIPWDVIVEKNILYVLLAGDAGGTGTLIQVLKAPVADMTHLEEIFRFNYASFARSFEVVNGDFYFGIGCEVNDPKMYNNNEISHHTGKILKLSKQLIEKKSAQ